MLKWIRILVLCHSLQLVCTLPTDCIDSLILLPEMRYEGITSADPFISLIDQAEEEILMAAYKLQEKKLPQKDLLAALKRAVERGVTIHLIAEDRLTAAEVLQDKPSEIKKGDSLKAYQELGVHVYSLKSNYNQTHVKFVIGDRKKALLGNTNFDKDPEGARSDQAPSRDFSVLSTNPSLIHELVTGFWADINGAEFPKKEKSLLWGPEQQRETFYALLSGAKKSIRIYQQDMTDKGVLEQLLSALERGVKVELIMSPHPFGWKNPDHNISNQQALRKVGGAVFLTNSLSIHAKVMIIDDQIMYLGSTNFYQPAIDLNRNVGLLTENRELIEQVLQVFEKDKAL